MRKARLGYGELQDLYSFSDNFYNALGQAGENQDAQYSDQPDYNNDQQDTPDTPDYQQQFEDFSNSYEDRIKALEDQVRSYQESALGYQPSDYLDDEPNFTTDFVYKNIINGPSSDSYDETQTPENLPYELGSSQATPENLPYQIGSSPSGYQSYKYKTKDESVDVSHTDPNLFDYLGTLPQDLQDAVLITSGNDSGAHVTGSKHYGNEAIDLRYNDKLYKYIANDSTAKRYGITTLNPNHGTAPHIHLQVNK